VGRHTVRCEGCEWWLWGCTMGGAYHGLVWGKRVTGLGRMGESSWLPPLLSPSPWVGEHRGVLWVQLRKQAGSMVARDGGQM